MDLNKIKYRLIALLLIAGCRTYRAPAGNYCIENGTATDNATLTFAADKSFVGKSSSDVMGQFTVRGFWETDKDTLLLKVVSKGIVDSIANLHLSVPHNKLFVSVVDMEENKPVKGMLLEGGEGEYVTDEKGEALLPFPAGNYLRIKNSFIMDSIPVSEIKGNSISIFLNFKNAMSYYLPIKWKVQHNRIVSYEKGYGNYRKCR